jgi:hypothetical protein
MTNKIRTAAALLLCGAVIFISACDSKKSDDALAQDTTLMRDLALANQDTASKPQLQDVAVTPEAPAPAPVEQAPAPRVRPKATKPRATPASRSTVLRAPAAPIPDPLLPVRTESGNTVTTENRGPEPSMGTISSGSTLLLVAGQRICTNTNSVGDRFTAQLAEAVQGEGGAVIPAGATAIVEIASLKRSNNANEKVQISLRVISVSFNGKTYPVAGDVSDAEVETVRATSRGDDARKVATGAAIGAIIGQILGHRTKSTVIGAGAGAAAGAVIANRTSDYDGCVPSGGRITVKLTQPISVQIT